MPDSDATTERRYLADANYHRLGYQLAAQLMHREETGDRKEPLFEKAIEILYGERRRRTPYSADAKREATEFAADAEAAISHLRNKRETKRLGIFRIKLSPKEERLEEFLCRTVLPCLTILIAASLRRSDPAEAESRIAELRLRAKSGNATEHLKSISYRALYNLACYEAGRVTEDSHKKALTYLTAALEEAPGQRRRDLGRWAGKDPSLKALREDPAFRGLVEPYA